MLIRAVAGNGVVQTAGMLLTFLVGVQLARGLGVYGYGQYGIAMAVISLATVPSEFGIPKLVTREAAAAATRNNWPHFFGVLAWAESMCWRISAATGIAVILGIVLFLDRPFSGVGAAILFGTPVLPLFALAKIRGAALQGLNYLVLGQIPAVLVRPLLLSLLLFAIFLLEGQLSASDAMALNSVTAAAAFLLTSLWLKRRLPAVKPTQLVREGRQWLASSVPMALVAGVFTIEGHVSILLLGVLTSATEVGLFRIAFSIALMLEIATAIVRVPVSPLISRLHAEGDHPRLQKLLTHSAQAQFASVLLLSLPLLVAGEQIIAFVFGAEYEPAADVLRLLLLGRIISSGFGMNGPVLMMTHHERRLTRAVAIAVVFNIVAVAALAPAWGNMGAGIGFLISMSIWNFLTWRDSRRLLRLDTSALPLAC